MGISMPSRLFLSLLLGLSLSLGISGCEEEGGGGGTPFKPRPAKKKDEGASKEKTAAASDEAAAEDERLAYSYNPIGKRDPFRSFISKEVVAPETRPETPLQKYEIDQYKLVGIVFGVDNPVAMVEDPDGMGHFLTRDTLIGKNWGKVVRISPTEVIVAEEYRDFEGKLIVNEIPLRLPAENESQ